MRTSIEVADIFRAAGPAYRSARAGHLSLDQLKIMSAIEHCRTAVMGGHVEACTDCGHWRVAYNSCRNRHCPRATDDGLWGKRFRSGWPVTAMTSAINSDEPRCDNREELQAWIWAGTVG